MGTRVFATRRDSGEVRTCEQLVAEAKSLKDRYGFTSHKLKGGVFPPEYKLECYRAIANALPGDSFRFDPSGVWSTEQAIWFGQRIEDLKNDYLEDPVFGLHGMRRTREKVRMPLPTNRVVVGFEQLAANIRETAVDVVLLDAHYHHLVDDVIEGGKLTYCHGARCLTHRAWASSSIATASLSTPSS